ncbi:metallo-beta-lactamase family protein (plasmid) [Sinorhizobium americanum CCGM7]|uniref:MBL fold metallo-hydrolase n=1 Tax=Sinorhizobium americanum TaxID=194963 RepID=UPI0004D47E3D|nr:MBL fold metallo-hydrolase [Sinorhizobium americanum]APG86658.1 metallo-beta-lactamase family protein [Sinorhizobium americanum CCGM7]
MASVGLASPLLLAGAGSRSPAFAEQPTAPGSAFQVKQYKFGSFKVTIISDGASVQEKPWETYGTDQPQEAVKNLLERNFLPTDRFAVSYAPAIIDTGSEVILVDTGFGETLRSGGAGKMLQSLAAAGYTADQVTMVVLTHLHRDHIGGLMEAGSPTFKNARYAVNATEYDFWVSDDRKGSPAEANHLMVLSHVKPLAAKMTFLKDGQDIVSGITAVAAYGHSPGHTILNIESDGKRAIAMADTAVHYALNLQRPDWEMRFDMDKAAAAVSRKRVLDMIATDRVPLLGYHMPHPSVGFLERRKSGYNYIPASYQFET